eukprot:2404561-Amphidinium_carterae.1
MYLRYNVGYSPQLSSWTALSCSIGAVLSTLLDMCAYQHHDSLKQGLKGSGCSCVCVAPRYHVPADAKNRTQRKFFAKKPQVIKSATNVPFTCFSSSPSV